MRHAIIVSTAILTGAAGAAHAGGLPSQAPSGGETGVFDNVRVAQMTTYDSSRYGLSGPDVETSASGNAEESGAASGETAPSEAASKAPAELDADPDVPADPASAPATASTEQAGEPKDEDSFLGSLYESIFGSDEGETVSR